MGRYFISNRSLEDIGLLGTNRLIGINSVVGTNRLVGRALGKYLTSYEYNLRIVSQLLSAAAYDDDDNDNAATDDEWFI